MTKSSFRYLYVEDDPLSREVMQTLLEEVVGVSQLTLFEDSQDFISRLKALNPLPDVVLLDIQIEPLNGFDLLSLIRRDPALQALKVLAVTATVMSKQLAQIRAAGFDGVIAKPLDMLTFPELVARLEQGEAIWQV